MSGGGGSAGPATAVQGFVNNVMSTVTAPIDALNLGVAKATLGVLEFLPKFPAVRLFSDLIFQFGHSHPHPPTFGFPLPSVGPVLASGCWGVLINGQPAARNGDMGLSVWCGGYFPIFEIFMGSSHVFMGGSRAARAFIDPSFHCLPDPFGGKYSLGALDIAGAVFGVGMSALNVAASMEQEGVAVSTAASAEQGTADAAAAAADAAAAGVATATAAAQLAADVAAAAMGLLMGKDPGVGFPFGIAITGSPNVLVGGFPMPGWMTILKGLAKLLKPLIRRIQVKLPPGKLRNALCALTGHPVDVASGRMFTRKTDLLIDGRVPISFDRIYDTSATDYEGPFGWGWTHPYDQHLWESKKYRCLVLRNDENRQVRFDLLKIGDKYFQPLERTWLERKSEFEYEMLDCKTGLTYEFGRLNEKADQFTGEENALRLLGIRDRNDNNITLTYKEDLLRLIENGSGVSAELKYAEIDGKLRLVEIRENLTNGQSISLMNYGYDGEGQLLSATNRTYVPYNYYYENRLMTRETNRSGLSFYFEYEGQGPEARCTHTWGDGGIYERWITYAPQARITRVKDGLGGETTYHFNELDLVTEMYDAMGGIQRLEYGERGELLKETDPLGRNRTYSYDDQLNRIAVVREDGTSRGVLYDLQNLPVLITDEAGAQWKREYDAKGNLVATVNPLGAKRAYRYNEKGDVSELEDALGNVTKFDWASSGAIAEVTRPGGARSLYKHNERGILSEIFNESTGLRFEYSYDDQGRLTRASSINQRKESFSTERYEYDASDNLTVYTDPLGHKTYYKFVGFEKLSERTDAIGNKRSYSYDVEERLTQITNERGENYFFEYDKSHRVVAEVGFDGARTEYRYNQAGEPVYQKDALGREMFYRRDEAGRVASILRSDMSEIAFEYDQCSRVTSAKNSNGAVKFEYDAAWQVTKEDQSGQIIEYTYDAEGNRLSRSLPGKETSTVKYSYDPDGNITRIKAAAYDLRTEFDAGGRLTRKNISGRLQENLSYDLNGRLDNQRISVGAGGSEIVRRSYAWNALGNVSEVRDSLRGDRAYTYDPVERLAKVERLMAGDVSPKPEIKDSSNSQSSIPPEKRLWQADDFSGSVSGQTREAESFTYDGAGNLLERNSTANGSIRAEYKQGNRIETRNGTEYIHDALGNLIQKRSPNGETLRYEYDIDNQLISVEGAAGGRVEFRYDAFGRRIAKITKNGTTGFLWDGDVLLGEQTDTFREYIHDGFAPLARLSNSGVEVMHTDYLGTPKEVTDLDGRVLWQGNYDEFGRVRARISETDQNIRFQGQYEDAETGLFYNRFRYYDAETGRYINQDPIRLEGSSNFYGYGVNPLMWIDPLGLVVTPTITRGHGNRAENVTATVNKSDLGTGTGTNASSIAGARSMGNANDDAGHLLARRLGGSGGVDGVFPQSLNVNRGAYRVFEGQVADLVATHGKANVDITFHYKGNSTRPHAITYKASAVDSSGNLIEIEQKFKNPPSC